MQMKRKAGFLDGLRRLPTQAKPKRRKINPQNVTNKDLWQSRRKKGRLVVRNLPFKITDEKFKEHFETYGEIKDVKLLRRNDGKLTGCGFIEFEKQEEAKKAIEECSGKPIMGRPIIVDWAVPKDVYKSTQKQEIKEEPEDEIKEEPDSESDDEKPDVDVKEEPDTSEEEKSEESSDEDDASEGSDEEKGSDSEGSIGSDVEEEEDEMMSEDEEDSEEAGRKRRLADLDQGKTVFLKCVPFSATEEDLRECLGKFGPIAYALICVDHVTEHSKGTAFVKFRNKESADKCLEAGASDLRIGTGVLDPHLALDKRQLQKKFEDKKEETKKKDNRNLYLIKEGVILAGSSAAKGLSPADMAYRLQLEHSKSQMLKNLSMVVSQTRLAVHNLPENYSDQALRNMCKKFAPDNAKIVEARIMRDLKKVDEKGRGLSKGFAFVSFSKHEHALAALRAINNNPNIFTPLKRPIVSFSIENKAVLNARQKRLQMSQVKNPSFVNKHSKQAGDPTLGSGRQKQDKVTQSGADYVGIEAHKSQTVKLPTRKTLKAQAALHRESIMSEKKKVKRIKQAEKQKLDRKKKNMQPKTKKNKKAGNQDKEEKAFDQMVNKYKSMVSNKNIKKWYE